MKISKVKHVIITSIIFLLLIAALVWYYQTELDKIPDGAKDKKKVVVAITDIKPGTQITENNYNRYVQLQEKVSLGEMKDEVTKLEDIVGKVAIDTIYTNQTVLARNVKPTSEVYAKGERLYTIPFDSATTGGYNIKNNELVDICISYNDFSFEKPNTYQPNLDPNKKIDIVLAKKRIVDIRDESGNTITTNEAVVPGYVCFRLTYDEINKLEVAKKQGTLFIGKVGYYQAVDAFEETFMKGTDFNKFNLKPTGQALEVKPAEPEA